METPACENGTPIRQVFLPLCKPLIDSKEIDAVKEILTSGWLTTGHKVQEFESNFKEYIGCKHAIALNSATAALHLSLIASGIKEGDELILPTLTFVACAHVIKWTGATPILVDINEDDLNIDIDKIKEKITEKTKAIMPVHYAGQPCNMDEILNIAQEHNLKVIEDAAHAVGASYKDKKIGNIGDTTSFSFYAIKNITTGEGGMLTTNDDELAKEVRKLAYFGVDKDAYQRYQEKGTWYYEIEKLGYKYNMDNIHGAIGVEQLKKLDIFNNKRKQLAKIYTNQLQDIPEIRIPTTHEDRINAWHLYPIIIDTNNLNITRDKIIDALREENIGVSVHFIPLHKHPYFQEYQKEEFPIADKIYEGLISLPLFPGMEKSDVEDVVNALKRIINFYRK
jgi:UDP-4-amino-4,6-dideoxy-N-acetyl-beta-L-altrosamine transaminase